MCAVLLNIDFQKRCHCLFAIQIAKYVSVLVSDYLSGCVASLCLLQTTTINCLTGVIPASGGDALVYGEALSSTGGMDRIRSMMGVCPQFDVLWSELTGLEHLTIYGNIKVLAMLSCLSCISACSRAPCMCTC